MSVVARRRIQPKLADRRRVESHITLAFDIPPGVNSLYFNAPGKGRIRTRDYEAWRQSALTQIMIQRPGRIEGKYGIALTINENKTGTDIDGLFKPVLDILVKMGVTDDDKHCRHCEATWTDDEAVAGLEVRLWEERRA